ANGVSSKSVALVRDTTPPVITLQGADPTEVFAHYETYTEEGATANDNFDGNVTVTIGGDTVDPSTLGTYLVTYDATDSHGNAAVQVTRTVVVVPPAFNEALGTDAGDALTTGAWNVMLGDDAAFNLSSSSKNVLIGNYTGFLINKSSGSDADRNVLVGFRAAGGYTQAEWDAFQADPTGNPLPGPADLEMTGDDNLFLGWSSGLRNQSGFRNVFVGSEAGFANQSGHRNTFVGTAAGKANTTGSNNTLLGNEAGETNTNGRNNTFVGERAGRANTTADENTAVGGYALYQNTTGWGQTILGFEAGYDLTTGIKNTCLGWGAGVDLGTASFNTMVGAGAGNATEHTDFNTFVGVYAGASNNVTNGTDNANRNTYFGAAAGLSNREGSNNVAIGSFADMADWSGLSEQSISDAFSNTATPSRPNIAADPDTDVSRAVNIGSFGWVTGDDAIGIGYRVRSHGERGIAIGANTSNTHLESVTIGAGSTSHADRTVVIGNESVTAWHPATDSFMLLGGPAYRFADVHAQSYAVKAQDDAASASIQLFADEGNEDDDKWTLRADDGGNLSVSSLASGAPVDLLSVKNSGDLVIAGDLISNSDARLKQEIAPIEGALKSLGAITGRTYRWRQGLDRDNQRHYGLVAQEVEKAVPELVTTNPETGIKSVNYQGFVPLLIEAVHELQDESQCREELLEVLRRQSEMQLRVLEQLDVNNSLNPSASR
ncbi:MAG: DUF5011 domain-containing protein, partial [bacterium]|nr:DUF5011 domain-containing protein [bacterium]